jgi:hypothetical protein
MKTSQANTQGGKLPARSVAKRYGVCSRTLHRWMRDEKLGFPQPLVINGRMYFDEDALTSFDRRLTVERAGA